MIKCNVQDIEGASGEGQLFEFNRPSRSRQERSEKEGEEEEKEEKKKKKNICSLLSGHTESPLLIEDKRRLSVKPWHPVSYTHRLKGNIWPFFSLSLSLSLPSRCRMISCAIFSSLTVMSAFDEKVTRDELYRSTSTCLSDVISACYILFKMAISSGVTVPVTFATHKQGWNVIFSCTFCYPLW